MISEGVGLDGKQILRSLVTFAYKETQKHCACRWLRDGSGVTKASSSAPAALPGKPRREVSESHQRDRDEINMDTSV